ncbi:MAG: ABC transporter permease [Chloroflexales bacterium]|nr:ABC transporter permease [Chloroflexales bacterium]
MADYILRRILYFIPTLFAISIVTFFIIQLPPGDFLTAYEARLATSGDQIDIQRIEELRERYGLNQPLYIQYWKWISGVVRGDFGYSLQWRQPVSDLLGQRMFLTFILALATTLFVWIVAVPIGIYSAMNKYTVGDYTFSLVGFLGMATPDFLFALVLMWIALFYFGQSVGGLFSPEFENAPWSWAKVLDLLKHLWIPIVVIGTNGTAGMIRILRANLLDELNKPYVETARAKGLTEWRLTAKYPVRVALNPFISGIGDVLPGLISGATITSIVLSLPTAGPLLLQALLSQDMYLAGSYIFMLSVLSVIGVLISDLLLAWLDPRIRYQ